MKAKYGQQQAESLYGKATNSGEGVVSSASSLASHATASITSAALEASASAASVWAVAASSYSSACVPLPCSPVTGS